MHAVIFTYIQLLPMLKPYYESNRNQKTALKCEILQLLCCQERCSCASENESVRNFGPEAKVIVKHSN